MTEQLPVEDRARRIANGVLPNHVAIIMDGNGRWAAKQNLKRIDGHRAGIQTVRRVVRLANDLGIKYLTLYTFSSENWNRPPGEVMGLMKLFAETLENEIEELQANRVRVMTIGDLSLLPRGNRDAIARAKEQTAGNDGLAMILALNYGGRDEIVRAIRTIASQAVVGTITPDRITPETISGALDTAGIPDPDLLVRTSGEYRLSNFLLWQLAYTELWITPVLWPDFSEQDFLDALESYAGRERRYGKTTRQVAGVARKIMSIFSPKDSAR